MNKLTRRDFMFKSTGAATGMFIAPGLADASDEDRIITSGLVTGQPKPLTYKFIPGFLSAEQIAPHYSAHYGGALRGYSAADARLQSNIISAIEIDSAAYGALQRARTSKGNSVLLHELYFDGLVPKSSNPEPGILRAIEKRFGSLDKWAEDFQTSARTAAGWAMLTYHPVNGKLYNVVSDEHATGILWMATPLVVIDVYETRILC